MKDVCDYGVKEERPWKPVIKAVLEDLKRTEHYKIYNAKLEKITGECGEELKLINMLIHLCNNTKQHDRAHDKLFDVGHLFEMRSSQQPSDLVETYHSQSLIIIYKSKGKDTTYALQIGTTQIIMCMPLLEVLICCLKSYYVFNLVYPPALEKFCVFWEKILSYGTLEPNNHVKRILKIFENIGTEADDSDQSKDDDKDE